MCSGIKGLAQCCIRLATRFHNPVNGHRVLGLKHLDGILQPDIFDHGILLTVPECINALCDKLTNRGANIIDTIRLLEANGFFQRFRGQGGERGLC